jgi:hypothetical protein
MSYIGCLDWLELFKQLKKVLIERTLGAELTEHLGYETDAL